MTNTYLSWISDEDLFRAIRYVHSAYESAAQNTDLEKLTRNVIDPFSFFCETSLAEDISVETWLINEAQRQIQKTLSNALGDFHQMILGSVEGWENLGTGHSTGLDLKRSDNRIYVELKNKHNTMNASNKVGVFQKLEEVANSDDQPTCYLVQIIRDTKHPYEKQWVFKSQDVIYQHPRVLRISGDLFYDMVAGQDSLKDLVDVLPSASDSCRLTKVKLQEKIKAVEELQRLIGNDLPLDASLSYFAQTAFPERSKFRHR
ncbi:MAG: Eco47II family restriction endonuclease [Cyanobacteria bacterium J06638_20]